MGRAAWLLLAWISVMGCDEADALSLPAEMPSSSQDDSAALDVTDEPSVPKANEAPTRHPTTPSGTPWAGMSTDDVEPTAPLADALDRCANDEIDVVSFVWAFEARQCEEWEACTGSACVADDREDLEDLKAETFDVEAACTCLESAWACEAAYGRHAEMWVVVPDLSCFEVY